MREVRCLKCGSSSVIPNVSVFDPGHFSESRNVKVAIEENPHAWLFKGEVRSSLEARVSGACGYTELYAKDAAVLLAAYRKQSEHS